MAEIKVRWTVTKSYDTEIEVDGLTPDLALHQKIALIREALGDLSSEQLDRADIGAVGPFITHMEILRHGELTPEVPAAPKYEADF